MLKIDFICIQIDLQIDRSFMYVYIFAGVFNFVCTYALDKLEEAGGTSTLHVIQGAGHMSDEFQTQEIKDQLRSFLDLHLKTDAWSQEQLIFDLSFVHTILITS